MKRGRGVMFAWTTLCLASAALVGVSRCRAQAEAQPDAQVGDAPLYTLHTYANLVQIPTLVLSWKSKALPLIARENFAIRLDSGPPFQPTAMHVEGNDAIDLSVLLDASGDQKQLLEHFDDAMAAMARTNLLPHDHVTIYALDCTLVRVAGIAGDDAAGIKAGVARALSSPSLHGAKGRGCQGDILLRDSLVWIGNELAHSAGRRVILTICDGEYDKSPRPWAKSGIFLSGHGVAVFSIHEGYDLAQGSKSDQQLFQALCETSGGMSLIGSTSNLEETLERFISLVRGRYILEFPKPSDDRPGDHNVEINVPGTHDFVVHTGAIVPLPDPSTLTDPNTVPTAKSPATFGKRHPITPNP